MGYLNHTIFVFTDKKPMKEVGICNKKVCQFPLIASIPFVDTGFAIRT